jgi:hypothetical protein
MDLQRYPETQNPPRAASWAPIISNLAHRRFQAWSRLCPYLKTPTSHARRVTGFIAQSSAEASSSPTRCGRIHPSQAPPNPSFRLLSRTPSGKIVDLSRSRRAYLPRALKRHRPFPQCANSVARNLTEIWNCPMISTRLARNLDLQGHTFIAIGEGVGSAFSLSESSVSPPNSWSVRAFLR